MDRYFTYTLEKEYSSIYSSESLTKKFESALPEYFDAMKLKYGGRKQKFPMVFSAFGKTYSVEINKNTMPKAIYRAVIAELIWNKYRYGLQNKYKYNFEYSPKIERNRILDLITGFHIENDVLVFDLAEDTEMVKRQNIVNEFGKFMEMESLAKQREDSIAPDFTNYLEHQPSKIDYSIIDEYIDLLIKFKDEIKLDYYTKFLISLNRGSYQSQYGGSAENLKDAIHERIESTIKVEDDIIGIIPTISSFSAERFFETDLLSFRFIYNDNRVAVEKHIREEEGKAISAYYASKEGGGYCGD